MIIGGLQRTSLIDYPGKVAAVVFTMGCPFRCHYCHNPGFVIPERFVEPTPERYVIGFLRSRIGKLDGVVVTGGEPTIQRDLPDFLAEVKGMGYQVKLDTSGINPNVLVELIGDGLVDYVAMDIKAPLNRYSEVAGAEVSEGAIRKSIEVIERSGIDYEFRTTVVREQLSGDDIMSIAESIKGAKRYVLQRFRGAVTLNPGFGTKGTYSDAEFEVIRQRAAMHVAACEVR